MKSLSQSGTSRLHFRRLDECCTLVMGQSPPGESYSTEPVGMPFFQGKADFGPLHPQARVWCSNPLRIAEKEDILICVRAPVGPVNVADQRCCIGRGLAAVRPRDGMDGGYLYWWLRNSEVQLQTLGSGSTFQSIGRTVLATFGIPVPPLADQQRIAAKLDEQMAALDRAEKALADQQAAASLLTAAVLRGILASPFSGTWPLVSLREASYIISKGTTPTSIGLAFSQSGIPFIRAEDIQGGEIDIRSVRMHIDEPTSKVLARSSLQPGDLLVTIAGTLGRVGYVPDDTDELNCNQAVAFVRLKPEILNVQYACISLQNGILASCARADGAGNSIQNMSLAQLGELTLPVPPLAVQRQLVSSMRAAQDRVKSTLTSIEGRLAAATVLKAALLDAAFSGEV